MSCIEGYHNLMKDGILQPGCLPDLFSIVINGGDYFTQTPFESESDGFDVYIGFDHCLQVKIVQQVMKSTRNGGMYVLEKRHFHLNSSCLEFNVPEILEPPLLHDDVLLHSLLAAPRSLDYSDIPHPYIQWQRVAYPFAIWKIANPTSLGSACSANLLEMRRFSCLQDPSVLTKTNAACEL